MRNKESYCSGLNSGLLMAQTSVYLHFLWGPGLSQATNFLLSFTTGSSCLMPCSPLRDPVSISKSSSFINVSVVHTRLTHLNCTSLSLLQLSSVLLTVKFFFNRPFANTNFARLLMRFMDFKWNSLFLFLFFCPTVSSFWLEQSVKRKINLVWP